MFRPKTLAQSRSQYINVPLVKAAWSGGALGVGLPPIFGIMVDYARSLGTSELPRYDHIRAALEHTMDHAQLAPDVSVSASGKGEYSWKQCSDTGAALPVLSDQDDPVFDSNIDWLAVLSNPPGFPALSNSLTSGERASEYEEALGERDPALDLPHGAQERLIDVWHLIAVDMQTYNAEEQ